MEFYECPDSASCSLSKQVDFYLDTYDKAGIPASVGYELGTPAYPDPTHDAEHQLPLTTKELQKIASSTQKKHSGFFWELFKPSDASSGQANVTQVAQTICNVLLPGQSQCSGEIPDAAATGDDDDDSSSDDGSTNVCDDSSSVCTTCDACCHSYLDGDSCDSCVASECAKSNVCDDDSSV